MGSFKKLFRKFFNRETISYVIVGVLTTAVDYLVFWLVNETLKKTGMDVAASASAAQGVSWFAAVVFAYFANKICVFRNRNFTPGYMWKEFGQFFAARVISGLVVVLAQWLLIDKLGMNEYIAKIFGSVFNLVFNYAASKLVIFREKT